MQSTIETNSILIFERDVEINSILKDVEIVNEIYKDLALCVKEQGVQLNTIYDNIESSLQDSEKGMKELQKIKKQKNCILS